MKIPVLMDVVFDVKFPFPYNPRRPLCAKCYRMRETYSDDEEEYCHRCKRDIEEIVFEQPLCKTCLRKHKKEVFLRYQT